MKRSLKNIIIILIIIAIATCSYFTMKNIKTNNNDLGKEMQTMQGGQNSNSENKVTPPQMPSGNSNENMGNPPEKPDGEKSTNTPPAMPSGNNNENTTQNNNQKPNDMPSMDKKDTNNQLDAIYYIIFGVEGLVVAILIIYLIMSKFNKLTLKETLVDSNKIVIFILLTIIITAILTFMQVYITEKVFLTEQNNNNMQQMMPGGNMDSSSSTVEKIADTKIDGTSENLTSNYSTSESDKSVILVENGGNLTLDGATVTKTGGDSTNTENSEFYGVNAGILVTENSEATIKNTTISTNAKGSNAVFSTGTDSKIYISDSTITTTGSGSARGLDATYGGYIEADNVNITTQGGSCATLATDRGEGTVIANNSKLETNGSGSPIIYSTGNISITNTEGTANGSQMVVIEGKNSASVKNSTLEASANGNRGDTDQAGIMIYQSMSGDAGEGTGTFSAENSTLSIQENSKYYETAPMFFVTNTDAVINLNNCKLSYGSNILISSKGTTEWGNSGTNGGNVTLNAENQALDGNIEIDNISTLTMNLTNSSYTGTINSSNTANKIAIKLDSNSTITLTGNSYISSLEDSDTNYSNINFNGYKLYVNGTAIN